MGGPGEQHDIFLTGATGLVGGELLRRALAIWPGARVHCLIRARDAAHLEARRQQLLERLGIGTDAARVVAVAGDVSRPGLGLADASLARGIAHVFHAAASTRFDQTLDDARALNVEGTRRVLDFAREAARAGTLERVHYVSTAYAVGDRPGLCREDDAPGEFRNAYEQSKREAEDCVREAAGELPATCYRPSIVVGDAHSGYTPHFRVLYEPVRWIVGGKTDRLPCRGEVRLDVVPVDWACDAILALAREPRAAGRVLHVTCGPEVACTIEEILDVGAIAVNGHRVRNGLEPMQKARIVSPEDAPEAFKLAAGVMRSHLPYMLDEQVFDTTATRALLPADFDAVPRLTDYFTTLIDYALDCDFGAS
jgi:nucleoside-diphosphate-sugar epimerase